MLRNIVFDLGRVLLHFDHALSFAAFEAHGAKFDRADFYRTYKLDEYERGDISGEDFISLLKPCFPRGVDPAAIESGWNEIFSPVDEMFELASLLRKNHSVYILSNTCDLHWNYCERNYNLSGLVDGTVTSFEARSRKPEAAIYRFTEKKFGLSPAETVFIDDVAENAHGAVQSGWSGIHHVTPERTKATLRSLGAAW